MVKTKWLILPMLIAFVTLPRLSTDLYLPSLPHIGAALNATSAELRMTMTIFMFGYGLSVLIAGPLADRLGRKPVMLAGLALYIVATSLCAVAQSITLLLGARFLQALGGCCGTVIARLMVKEAYPREEQIKILAHLSTAMAICPILVPILGGTLQIYFGWRASFCLLTCIALTLWIISKQQIHPQIIPRTTFSPKTLWSNYKTLLTHRLFIGYSVAISLAWCDYFAYTLESPFILQNTLGMNSVAFGFLFAFVVIGYLIGTQLTKHYANELGWDKTIFIATLICLLGSLMMTIFITLLPLNWQIITFPMLLVMIGVGIIIPCTQGAVMQPFPTMAGTASGLFFFIQSTSGGICGLILQSIRDGSVLPMALTLLLASTMLVLFFYIFIWRHNRVAVC
jgi:DHA1 family bicyclomycin/chloramphenicol resistance-like MFS transporter